LGLCEKNSEVHANIFHADIPDQTIQACKKLSLLTLTGNWGKNQQVGKFQELAQHAVIIKVYFQMSSRFLSIS